MSLRIKAVDVAHVKGRQLFFDANVLLYLYQPVAIPSNQWAINDYGKIFKCCLELRIVLCVDTIVLSEFINRLLRFGYDNYLKANGLDRNKFSFKEFRSTSEGERIAQDVEIVVKEKILHRFKMVGKLFNESDITAINLVNCDFNDELIVKTCQEHQCVLVTNDADFNGADIDILTANYRLL